MDHLMIEQSVPPTQEELDLEAAAWGFGSWAEFMTALDAASEPCGYCGASDNPNDMCKSCWDDMQGEQHGS